MTHRRHLPLADAPMRSNPPNLAVATALRAVIEEGLERFNASQKCGYKIYFNLALFVCAVVIK
jgi:hypothetical protein